MTAARRLPRLLNVGVDVDRMDEHQLQFLNDEFFSLTLMATVQRANVYSPGASARAKAGFQKALRGSLEKLEPVYRASVSEDDHIGHIVALAEALSASHADILLGRRFRIGTAQKALNLYLKYRWCIGKIPTPPHCPFDGQIISRLPGCRGISWTVLDSEAHYRHLVAGAKAAAKGVPLAVWELLTYNDAQPGVAADQISTGR